MFAGKKDIFKVSVEGNDILTSLIAENKGGIVLSSHIGNFEISGYLHSVDEVKMHSLFFGEERENWLKYRNETLIKNNITLIPISSDWSHIFTVMNVIKNGEFVAMSGDRAFHGSRVHKCLFMGKEASFPIGAFIMAKKLEIPVLSLFVMKSGKLAYNIFIKEIKPDSIPKMAEKFVSEIEDRLKEHPEQWFNFYDFWDNKSTITKG